MRHTHFAFEINVVHILLNSGYMESDNNSGHSEENQNKSDRQFEILSRVTILIFFIIICIAFFPIMRIFFVPIVIAAVFAGLLHPLYKIFYQIFWRKAYLASFLCCFLLILVVLIPSFFILQSVISQMRELYSSAIPWVRDFTQRWQEYPIVENFMNSKIGKWLIEEVDWPSFFNTITRNIASVATSVANRTYSGVFGLIADLVIMIFTLFYFLIDGEMILQKVKYLLPLKEKYQEMAFSSFLLMSKAIIKGTIIIGIVVGFFSAITLLIFGIETWMFWGFVVVVFSVIPLLGPSLIMVPAAIFKIISGHIWQGIGILLVTYIVLINIDNVIRPRVVGSSARMHDLLVFFSTLGGLSVFGVMGFIIGPVVAALFLTVLKIYSEEFKPQLVKRDIQNKNDNN
jgi:predicted PurR-regulated permease PerM